MISLEQSLECEMVRRSFYDRLLRFKRVENEARFMELAGLLSKNVEDLFKISLIRREFFKLKPMADSEIQLTTAQLFQCEQIRRAALERFTKLKNAKSSAEFDELAAQFSQDISNMAKLNMMNLNFFNSKPI